MNEQTNRHAMIRCVRAKSSMGYPEVFHRFCGYLGGAEKIFRIFYCDESYALSSGSRLNFAPASKKFRVLGTESSICNRTQISGLWVGRSGGASCAHGICASLRSRLQPDFALAVARTVQPRKFVEKMPSRASIS
jgi:hypothetical protein